MRIRVEKENGQLYVPIGKQDITIEKGGYKKATVLAYIDENGIFDIIKKKNVEVGQKPVNILNKDALARE